MTPRSTSRFLRGTLLADALSCVLCGLLMLLGAGLLAELLGLPAGLLRWAGTALLPIAALLVWLSRRPGLPSLLVRAVVVANIAWAAGCILLLGWLEPTTLGLIFMLAQALTVGAFALLEHVALRQPVPDS